MPRRNRTVILSAVEPSADILGAGLMRALGKTGRFTFSGCGGSMMVREGLESLFPVDRFSVIGPVGAVKALPAAMKGARRLARIAAQTQADAAVLIDSWAFSQMCARYIKTESPGTTLIKYVAPQVWASRPGRAAKLSALFDGLLTLFEFEKDWFSNEKIRICSVGNPIFQDAKKKSGKGTAFRSKYGLKDAPLLGVFPGSRPDEIKRLGGIFKQTAHILAAAIPALRICTVPAPAVSSLVHAAFRGWPGNPVIAGPEERFNVFSAADVALAASGTVTTELAICKTPVVTGYAVGWMTEKWIRKVMTTPYVSMINIASGRYIIPEFLQGDCRPDTLAASIFHLFRSESARKRQLEEFPSALERLGATGRPADLVAAKTVSDWIDKDRKLYV